MTPVDSDPLIFTGGYSPKATHSMDLSRIECSGLEGRIRSTEVGLVPDFHGVLGSVAQPCPTPRDPMDSSLAGSSVHGILQARILEWVAMPSRGIFPTEGSNPHLLHWQAGSPPLS